VNVVHTIPSVDDEASGPSYSVMQLSTALNEAGAKSIVIATSSHDTGGETCVRKFPRRPPDRLGRSPGMLRWLRSNPIDLIHNHSLWMMPNIYPGWVARERGLQLVVSPRGTLSEWALDRSRFRKRVVWTLWQRAVLERASLFHATSEHEYLDIRRAGFRQPVAVIPNGVSIPPPAEAKVGRSRTVLFLGRLHPVKGVDSLLRAWRMLGDGSTEWRLRIVGPGEETYVRQMRLLARSLALSNVVFEGPRFGGDKDDAYRGADVFVLPTHSENFGMAIAEALAAGCPVVTTRAAPWAGLEKHGAGWWIAPGDENLAATLRLVMQKDRTLLALMGDAGRQWMERDFGWRSIAGRMLDSYRWLLSGGPAPDWIHRE